MEAQITVHVFDLSCGISPFLRGGSNQAKDPKPPTLQWQHGDVEHGKRSNWLPIISTSPENHLGLLTSLPLRRQDRNSETVAEAASR
jgi:hypothetical protein